jgi:hypothetical protein
LRGIERFPSLVIALVVATSRKTHIILDDGQKARDSRPIWTAAIDFPSSRKSKEGRGAVKFEKRPPVPVKAHLSLPPGPEFNIELDAAEIESQNMLDAVS